VKVFPSRRAETVRLDDLAVAVHGRSFPNRAVDEDFVPNYPDAISGYFNIGVLHTSATGREGHDTYAPCTVEGLRSKGYDYWALGHVHTREILSEDPWVVFPGNTQGRHIRETGPKGCTLVTFEDDRIDTVVHHDLDVMRWERCEVDASQARSSVDVLDLASSAIRNVVDEAEDLPVAIRLTVAGASDAHAELAAETERWTPEIRAQATDLSNGSAWIEKVRIRTESKVDLTQLRQQEGPLSGLLEALEGDGVGMDDELLAGLQELRQKIPLEALDTQDGLDFDTPSTQREVMTDVRHILLSKLTRRGTGA